MDTITIVILLILGVATACSRIARKVQRTKKVIRRTDRPTVKTSPPKSNKTKQPASFDQNTSYKPKSPQSIKGFAYIVDGDTLTIKRTQIRLFGIDAPELDHPYGQKAKWALVGLCKGRKVIADIISIDEYGRTVAKCRLEDGSDLSAEMVKMGLAIDWEKYSGGEYKPLETSDARKKLWLADARQKGRMDIWERYERQEKEN